MDTAVYLDFALEVVKKTRSFIKNKRAFCISNKEDGSVVTEVDQEIELLVKNEISKKFPSHGIIGEEYGTVNEGADYTWFIDPIDGTISFSNGIPLYGTILALHRQGAPIVGIIEVGLCFGEEIYSEHWGVSYTSSGIYQYSPIS